MMSTREPSGKPGQAPFQQGEHITNEEAYEILSEQDAVIIGDVETCRRKMKRYQDIGLDRLMCFQQVGNLAYEDIMTSIRLVGEQLIPEFDPEATPAGATS